MVTAHTLYDGASMTVLASGMRVLVEEVPSSRSISAGIWIGGGSRSDPVDRPGLSHAVEHLLFKGTSQRSADAIACEIEDVGGHLNAATGRESTLVYAEAPAESLVTVLDLLADLARNPKFPAGALDLERGVLLEEIRNRDDDPEQCAYDLFANGLWDPPHALGRSVLGTREMVETLTCGEIKKRHRGQYTPSNMVLAVCGSTRAKDVPSPAEERFVDGEEGSEPPPEAPPTMGFGERVHRRNTAQSHVYVALPGPSAGDDDRFPLEILNSILGDGLSSRLFRAIREERGLAYAVSSAVTHYSDVGVWTFYAGVAPENAWTVRGLVLEELERLRREGVTADEVDRAKSKLRGHLILSLESNGSRMIRLGTAVLSGREILSPDALIARVEGVSSDELDDAIARYVRTEAANIAEVGPDAPAVAASGAHR
ncbi:MAG: insulinase family protein [Candidatus Bipolaricaulota bacterium]|nr:MAG: insulinase family protein [Candidatus Bipolaricaulota bacterium]